MKERAQELKAEARRGSREEGQGGREADVLAKIAEMKGSDRAMAKRNLDEGAMWPTVAAEEARIGALVKKAVS